MRLNHREAQRFERALADGQTTDEALAPLVADAYALTSAGSTAGSPRPEFVASLRERLVAEAAELPARPRATRSTTEPTTRPLVVVIGRGVPRAVAGLTATVLAVGGIVGAASQSALPGGTLYPVRGFLDGVAVQLSGSDYDRGVTGLSQAEQHVTDVRTLAADGEQDTALFVDTLGDARSSVDTATNRLLADYRATSNPQALLAITDFVSRVDPLLDAAADELPGAALPQLSALREAVDQAQRRATVTLAACAPGCISTQAVAELVARAGGLEAFGGSGAFPALDGLLGQLDLAGENTTPTPSASAPVQVPDTAVTAPPRGSTPAPTKPSDDGQGGGSGSGGGELIPGVPVTVNGGSGGASVGIGNGGATIGTGGVTVNGPTIPLVPSVGVTVPTIVVGGKGGTAVSVPDQTLGGIVVPGLTVKVPRLLEAQPPAK